MSEQKWESMNDADFDSVLQGSLPEPPPDDIVAEVTPWKKAMNRVLTGLALSVITLNFLALNYILPAIGLILMLLGFRTLRRENGWFCSCYAVCLVKAAYFFPSLILNATTYQSIVSALPVYRYLTAASLVLTLIQFFCLWRGIKAVKRKAGLAAEAAAAGALIVWYLIIAALVLLGYGGTVVGIAMIVSCFFIIRGLYHLSSELDEAGYIIQTASVHISDKVLVRVIGGLLAAGIVCGYLFAASYPMNWVAVERTEEAETTEIKYRLIELGFPENVLEDMAEADLLECRDAFQVVVDVTDKPVNRGREVVEYEGNTEYHTTVYDVKELRITGVAVELPGERETWKVIHHFQWLVDPGFYGTESIQLWPTYYQGAEGWDEAGEVAGRVLHTLEGEDYAASYYSLGSETFTSNSIFWGERSSTDVFASFSMPKNSEDQRGYISYTTTAHYADVKYIMNSWVNYTHQRGWLQYPVNTATEYRMSGAWNDYGPFVTVQDALQFYNTDDGIDMLTAEE